MNGKGGVNPGFSETTGFPAEDAAGDARKRGAGSGGTWRWQWHGEADDQPFREWLVDQALPKVGTGLLSGQWGMLKTFLALDLARATITKTTFAGRQLKRQGGVLLIAAEGQNEVRIRVEGIAQSDLMFAADAQLFNSDRLPFAWVGECPRLTADNAYERLVALIADGARQMQERFSLPVALIIIDAMTSAAGFRDANDTAEAQRVMDVLSKAAREAVAFVLIVDHFGKDASTGTRNSSAKEDAADAILVTLADRTLAGVVGHTRLAFRKAKGGKTGQEVAFSARTVEVVQSDGAETTLVIEWTDAFTSAHVGPKRLPKSLAIFKRALDYALANSGRRLCPFLDGPEVQAVDREAVRHEFVKAYPADNARAKAKAFERCEMKAVAEGLMTAREMEIGGRSTTFVWLTKGE